MDSQRKNIVVVIIVFLVIAAIIGMVAVMMSPQEKVYVEPQQSYFESYEIKDDKVEITLSLYLVNSTGEPQSFKLSTEFIDDQENGLLKEARLQGYTMEGQDIITLTPYFSDVVEIKFIGAHGTSNDKAFRDVPKKYEIKFV